MLRVLLLSLLACSIATPTLAQSRAKRKERANNRAELKDDQRDLKRFANLLTDLRVARQNNDIAKLKHIDNLVMAALEGERRESVKELKRDRKETRRSERRAHRAGPITKGNKARAARDDRRDQKKEARQLGKSIGIKAEYRALMGKTDKRSLDRKIALLKRALREQGRDIKATKKEKREDRPGGKRFRRR